MKFKSEVQLEALNNATVDTDKFLVSDGDVVKYRTGAQLLSDIGSGVFVPYTGATSDVNLGEFGVQLGNLEFDLTPTNAPTTVGSMYWNDPDGTADLILKGGNVTLQIGQETVARVVNKTVTNITLLEANYQAVRVTGAQGQRPKVDLAQADNDLDSASTLGLVTETILINQEGFITTSGQVREINTTGSLQGETWLDGDILYLSGTVAGRITNIKPIAPIHTVIIGFVEYAHAIHGKIFVKVNNGYELEELHNVSAAAPNNNEVLVYDTPSLLWTPKTIPTILGYTPANANGTTNYISKFTGSTTLGNSLLYDNGTNVGIGTATPTAKLDVVGTVLSTKNIINNNGGGSSLDLIWNGVAVGEVKASSYDLLVGTPTGGGQALAFQTNGIERARFANSTGNFGIGTTTPFQKLTVAGGQTLLDQLQYTRAIYIGGQDLNNITIAGFYNGDSLINSPSVGWFYITVERYSGDEGWVHQTATSFGVENIANIIYTRTNVNGTWGAWKTLTTSSDISGTTNYISKFTGANSLGNSLLYDNGTNVGIGTTNPESKLEVYDTNPVLKVSQNPLVAGGASIILTAAGSASDSNAATIQFHNAASLWSRTDQSSLRFGNASKTEIWGTLGSNVGIGTVSPTEKLEINGYTLATGYKIPSGLSSWFLKADGTYDSGTYALDSNVVHLTGNETITGTKTFNGTLNTTTSIFNLAAVDNFPTGGVPDAIRSYINGHNGTSGSFVSSLYGVMQNSKNVGVWIDNPSTASDAVNSIGFRVGFKSTSTTNDFFIGSRGSTNVFRVNDYGDIYGTKTILGTTVDNTIDTLQVNGSARIVNLDPTGIGGITTKLLSYSADPYGLVFRSYATGEHSIQNQRESSDATLFPLILQPLGSKVNIGTLDTGQPAYGFNYQLAVASSTGGVIDIRSTNTNIIANSLLGRIQFTGKDDSTTGYTSAAIEAISYTSTNTGNQGGGILKFMTSPTGYASDPVERMRIDSSGIVSINTTVSDAMLNVARSSSGPVSGSQLAAIYANNTSTDTVYANSVGLYAKTNTTSGKAVYGDAFSGGYGGYFSGRGYFSGDVGIGITVATEKLHVVGNLRLTGSFKDSSNLAGTSGQVLSSTGTGTSWITNGGLKGIHSITKLSSGQSTFASISGVGGASIAGVTNRLTVYPYIPAQVITSASLYINVTTAVAGANAQILIYSDLNGNPDSRLYQSTDLDCSTIGKKTVTTTQIFSAGTTYWIGVHFSSNQNLSALNTAGVINIGINLNVVLNSVYITPAFGSAPATFGTPVGSLSTNPPLIGITL